MKDLTVKWPGGKQPLIFFVNGIKVVDTDFDPSWTLLEYLRSKLGLTGTKYGCGEGGCGACTVMVSKYCRWTQKIFHLSVNACLTPIPWVHGRAVTTVEGIGSTRTKMHAVQERLAKSHGSQCGFCTPGFVMSMYTLLRNNPLPTMEDIEEYFQGNLCRCTGYRAILEGYGTFTESGGGCAGCPGAANGGCCQARRGEKDGSASQNGVSTQNGDAAGAAGDNSGQGTTLVDRDFAPYDPDQEPIFPPELQLKAEELLGTSLAFEGKGLVWYRPVDLDELLALKRQYPAARIVGGNTEIGLEVRLKGIDYPVLISSEGIPELHTTELTIGAGNQSHIRVGGAVSLSRIEEYLKETVGNLPGSDTATLREILKMLEWFAGKQIRNVAAMGGNIVTSSPISDLNPLLMAGGAKVVLQSKNKGGAVTERSFALHADFFTGYRRNAMTPEEVLVYIDIPLTSDLEFVAGYKQAKRRDDDIAIVNAGLRLKLKPQSTDDEEFVIDSACLAFGGMAEKTVRALKTEKMLVGRPLDEATLELACDTLATDFPLEFGAPGGKERYRRTLVLSFFHKFWISVRQQLHERNQAQPTRQKFNKLSPTPADLSAIQSYRRGEFSASQVYQIVPDGQPSRDPVGRPVILKSAFEQCTGEAQYMDDMPRYANELHLYPVLSSRAKAKIADIDFSEAELVPGYVGAITVDDIPSKKNLWGVFGDDQIFYHDEVSAQAQVICAVVAQTRHAALAASRKVVVKYEDMDDPILTMEQAIERKSFFVEDQFSNGDIEAVLASAPLVISGEARVGGQEHFYLECQGALAIPRKEHGEMEVFCTNQDPATVQNFVRAALGVHSNRVVVRVKRIGGGFGGKEARNCIITLPTAIAAVKYQRPVSCTLERQDDIKMSGQRHGFIGRYRIAADKDGKLLGLDLQLYMNAGFSKDVSSIVLEVAAMDCTNAYKFPVVRVRGYCCKTNLSSNTAFRGFGAMQSMMICEQMMTHLAEAIGVPQTEIRVRNFKKEGCKTFYGQELSRMTLERCWSEVIQNSDYMKRLDAVEQFNKDNKWKKRGIAVTPETYGIAFMASFMNQAGALIHIYKDGSVLVTHGGVEMGQGLHTKLIQIASRALKIPPEYIHTSEIATDKVPNTSPTAGSFSTDLNGPAVQEACEILLQRLEPYMLQNPKGTWEQWVIAAYFDRVSLSATGFYRSPKVNGLFEQKNGNHKGPCTVYQSYGVAVSEVEVDCLTGDHKVLRTDIVFDVGDSINPAVDVGQIEGGFIQGYGLWTLEDIEFGPDGQIRTAGPSTYKIPSSRDIPEIFNVALLKGAPNPHAIYSSKAVGEPPVFLAASIFYAIREAIVAYRKQNGVFGHFQLDSPATSERIRMLCQDNFTKKVDETQRQPSGDHRPWTIQV